MSIYKPNGFYPYLQEVDLENLNGNTFSCQVNTDGAMCAGGKIKMYLPDDNTVLYDNLYQFQTEDSNGNIIRTPIPNGGMAEFKIEPYQINVNFNSSDTQFIDNGSSIGQLKIDNMNFIYLTPYYNYDIRKNYCPYNLFNIQIEKYVYVLILHYKDAQYDKQFIIPIKNINIEKLNSDYSVLLFNLQFGELYNFISNTLGLGLTTDNKSQILSSLTCYVSLKNDTNYLWECELFEHYFNENFDSATFISDGYITGSTQNVLWYDSISQSDVVKNNEELIKVDNYIEIEADSNTSDLFRNELLNGYTDKGNLSMGTNNKFANVIYTTSEKPKVSDKSVTNTNNYELKNLYGYYCDNYNNGYTLKEKLYDDSSSSIVYKDMNDIDVFITADCIFEGTSSKSLVIQRDDLDRYDFYLKNYELNDGWYHLLNSSFQYDEIQSTFIINSDNAKIGEPIYRISGVDSVIDDNYRRYPFILNSLKPIIVVTDYFDDNIKANITNNTIENSDGSVRDEILIILNNKKYRAKILFPAPYDSKNSYLKYTSQRQKVSSHWYEWNLSFSPYIDNTIYANTMSSCYQNKKYNAFCKGADYYNEFLLQNCLIKDTNDKIVEIKLPKGILLNDYYADSIILDNDSKISICSNCCPKNIIDIKFKITQGNSSYPGTMKWGYSIREKQNYNKCNKYICDNISLFSATSKNIEKLINISTYDFENPILYIDFYIYNLNNPSNTHSYNDYYSITDLQIVEINDPNDGQYLLKLDDKNVNLLNKNNMYLYVSSNDESADQDLINKNYKINKYSLFNNSVLLEDIESAQKLQSSINDGKSYQYEIKYKKRQPISWVTHNLGIENRYSKIELKEAMDVTLYDGEGVSLYATNNETSYNSFYGVKDTNLNVDNIYVRFPGYTGYDAMNNQILDNKDYYTSGSQGIAAYSKIYNSSGKIISDTNNGIKGWFYSDIDAYSDAEASSKITWSTDVVQNINLYGKQVRATAFDPIYDSDVLTSYCKLFKITSYNYETGEIVFAGGLERKILDTDKYEIWKADVIEGSSNKYDITEVIKSYTRLYPAAEDIDETAISCNSPLITEPIKIVNSTPNKLFIQPNINFYTNEYNKAYLYFPQFSEKSDVNYSYITKNNYNFYETSIEKLDNSQWLIYLSQPLSFMPYPGYIYNLYMDTVKSIPANYFYARTTPDIDVKIGDYQTIKSQLLDNNFIYNLDGYKKNLSSLTKIDDASTVKFIDVCFLTSYENCNTPIKRYRYKIYDSNMNLILDTDYIYDNLLMCNIRGLLNQQFYYLELECENQDNKVDTYSQLFKSVYDTIDKENILLELNNKDEYNCVSIGLKYKINSGLRDCTKNDFSNYNSVSLYKRKKTDTYLQWVCDIDVQNNFTNIIYDYNINNNVEYEYILIMINSSNTYYQSANSIFVKYDDWSMVDIIEDNDIYITDGDVWKFKYNLESSDIPVNNSVTLYDTLSKYPQFGYGKKSYASSGLSCLLGDVGVHYQQTACGIKEKDGYYETDINDLSSNNIAKYLKWKKFVGNNNMKLLKDIKGNKWIVRINEKPSVKNNDSSQEQLYTISFEWSEVMDSNNISIISVPKNN